MISRGEQNASFAKLSHNIWAAIKSDGTIYCVVL